MVIKTINKDQHKKGLPLTKPTMKEKNFLSSSKTNTYIHPSTQFSEKISPAFRNAIDKAPFDPIWDDVVGEALKTGLTTEEYLDFLKFLKAQSDQTSNQKPPIKKYLKLFLRKQKLGAI
jgi:hypothetical protein